VAVFGGTFDPIHYGHLRTAYELLEALAVPEIRFMPAGTPPHRATTVASNAARLEMVRVALEGEPRFRLDDRELRKPGPSYTVDTLGDLRSEHPERPLCLIVGMDAFLGLTRWHEWQRLLTLAHLVVAHRPGWRAPDTGPLGELLAARGGAGVQDLHASLAGRIYVHAVTQLEISSTGVRELIEAGHHPRYLMPDGVCRIIDHSGCYARKDQANG
jgi:nicotinate-nucleotide adenylyltransferase